MYLVENEDEVTGTVFRNCRERRLSKSANGGGGRTGPAEKGVSQSRATAVGACGRIWQIIALQCSWSAVF